MTRVAKLNARFLSDARLNYAEFLVMVAAYGFTLRRVTGSHAIYARDGIDDQLNLQPRGKDAKLYQVRQFRRIVALHNLTLDEEP